MEDSIEGAPRWRRPTLVEVVAALLALALLFTLFMGRVSNARELQRRASCFNNLRYFALATSQFDANHTRLPGWAEPVVPWDQEPAAIPVSWFFPILPFLERGDLFRQATTPGGLDYNRGPREWHISPTQIWPPHLYIQCCPNDATAFNNKTNISYVANAGYRDRAAEAFGPRPGGEPDYDGPEQDGPASAVFLNRYRNAGSKHIPTQTISWIAGKDGAANTLMFSENIHAGRWDLGSDHHLDLAFREGNVAFHFANTRDDGPRNLLRINAAAKLPTDEGEGLYSGANSYHPGGVVAAFCDGHTVFIAQEIDWKTWTLLFTPHSDELKTTWPDGLGEKNVFLGEVLRERY